MSFTQVDWLSADSRDLAGVWQGLRYARCVFAVIDECLGPESAAVCPAEYSLLVSGGRDQMRR